MMVAGGFDPGYSRGACAAVGRDGSRLILLHRELIVTKPAQTKAERVRKIWGAVGGMIRTHKVRHLGIEDQSGMSTAGRMQSQHAAVARSQGRTLRGGAGFNANNDNVIGTVWLAMCAAMAFGSTFEELNIKTIKLGVCGVGGHDASKTEVITAVRFIFPELADAKLSEHEADAIAAAIVAGRKMLWQEARTT